MKLLFTFLLFVCSIFANCPDASNADVSAESINKNYDNYDIKLADKLKKIISETQKHIDSDTNREKLSKDLNTLYINSLLDLKETQSLLDNQKALILNQR